MTYAEARRAMLDVFKARWDADAPGVNGGVLPPVRYDASGRPGDLTAAWARVTVKHSGASQGALSSAVGDRLWERRGIIVVQVFTTLDAGGGLVLSDALANVAKNAFEGASTSSLWFRNVRLTEIGADGPWFQVNVTADFEYTDRR